jgi:hypothetical protein
MEDNKPIEIFETKPDDVSSNSKPNTTLEECKTFEPILTGMLAKTFRELEAEAPTNPEVQEYLATFHKYVRNALRETDTPTGAIPFRGAMTLSNISYLFELMPDLYDYLGLCYGSIETSGDAIINEILDAANDYDYSIIKKIGEDKCDSLINNYIALCYYSDYLPGYKPIAFSVDDWYPPQQEFVIMPRTLYWWQEMKTLSWDEFRERYPEKMKEYDEY